MRKKSPIFVSALLLTGVNLLLRLVSTSFQVYISGRIGAAGVGLLQLVLSVGGMAMTAGIAGIRTATMYLTAGELGIRKPENVRHILSGCTLYSIVCSCAVTVLLYSLAPVLAEKWIGDPRSADAVRLFACFLPVSCLCGVMSGYFTAANRIGTLVTVEIAEQLFSMAVTMSGLILWAGSDPGKACQAVVLGSGLGACLTLALLTLLRLLERAPKGKPFPIRKRLLDTAVPLALADDLKAGINTVENLMVPKRLALFPGTGDPLAVFGTVCGMVFPVLMFPAAIVFSLAELLIPEMARCNAAGSRIRTRYLAKRSLRVVLIYSCIFCGLLHLLAQPLCQKLYNNADAGKYLALYALLAPMLYCDAIIDAMNKGLGQQKICVRYNILTAAMDVLFLFLLLPKYGMDGYFFSFVITHLVNFILSLRLLIRTAELKISFRVPAVTLLCLTAAVLLSKLFQIPSLQCISFLLLFGSLLTLFQIISREDLNWLKGLVK